MRPVGSLHRRFRRPAAGQSRSRDETLERAWRAAAEAVVDAHHPEVGDAAPAAAR